MTRSDASSAYDDDFFAWTQAQAAALRALPVSLVGSVVDIGHIAEEIEDLGKRDLREVQSLLMRLIEHLIKIKAFSGTTSVPHWSSEAIQFQIAAAAAFSPSMRQLVDVDLIWRKGRKAAQPHLGGTDAARLVLSDCPFSLDDLLAADFELDECMARIALAQSGPPRGKDAGSRP